MIRHVWSVMAAKSVIDSETDLISIYDIADTLNVEGRGSDLIKGDFKEGQPINIPVQSEVVSMFHKTSDHIEQGEIELVLIDPKGDILARHKHPIKLEKIFLRTRIKINGMGITESGLYKVQVSVREIPKKEFKIVADIPYLVNIKLT